MSKIDSSLIQLTDYKAEYTVTNKNQISLSKDYSPIVLQTYSQIKLTQEIYNSSSLINTYTLLDTNGEANNDKFTPSLEKGLIMSKIQDRIQIERNKAGKIVKVTNIKEIINKWEVWKEKKLYEFLPKLGEQEEFIDSYEAGLEYFDENLKYELQYIALFPECYDFVNYKYSQKDYTSLFIINSRLLEDLEIHYKFYPTRVKVFDKYVVLNMESQITNNIMDHPNLEKVIQDPFNNYQFKITLNYVIDKLSGELIHSELYLFEHINKYVNYKVDIQIQNKNRNIPEDIHVSTQKVYNGKLYTDKEWSEQEKKKSDLSAKDHNVSFEEQKPKKGGRFFLDEKESDF